MDIFSKDHRSIAHSVLCKGTQHQIVDKPVSTIMSDMQTLVVNSDQDASIVDVEDALMMEMRCIEECKVMPEESQLDASAANKVSKKSVWKMQSTRSLIAQVATFVPESETLAPSVGFFLDRWLAKEDARVSEARQLLQSADSVRRDNDAE